MTRTEDEWLWGWDDTPGIVSVWAEHAGKVTLWRRLVETGQLLREAASFRPWMLLVHREDVTHAGGTQSAGHSESDARGITVEELNGPGELRYLVRADDGRRVARVVCQGAERRLTSIASDPRDYGIEFYVHVLRSNFAARLARAFTPEDFETLFADPRQPSLFEASLASIRPILTPTTR